MNEGRLKMKTNLFISAAACALLAMPTMAATPMEGEKLAAEQVYTYRLLDDIKSFDPQINTDVEGSEIMRDLFEGLMNEDATGGLVPGAAESYTVSDDKLTYTFNLRDAKWSNGDPVTANDFVYAWRRLVDPATASEYAWYMELMGVKNASKVVKGEVAPDQLGVRAVDDKTFEVTIDTALPYFAAMTVHGSTFPVNQKVVETHGSEWTKPGNLVGNGAYVLTEYRSGERVVRERNPMYWDDANTIIEKTVGLIVNDENIALTRYLAGEMDQTDIPAGQYPRLKAELPDDTYSYPRSCSYIYWFNQGEKGNPALKDARVRKALSYTIDREVVVDRILQGGQYQSYNFTHQKTAGFELPEIDYASWTQAERDAKAKELLAEAGYGPDNPLSVKISYNTDEAHKKIAIAVSQFWKQKLGVNTELANSEWKVHTTNMQNGDYEIARYAWCGDYNEASTYLDLMTSYSGHNVSGWSDPEYDKLMKDSKTMADPNPNYAAGEQLLADNMVFAPIYQYTGIIMLKPEVKGFPIDNLMQNWYSRELYIVEK
ncbi:oligopeptide ABC transporter substrate-binding protein OppA [Amylibacter kogurei]|uniref:Oligopeptide ABC transporter substrate-binding protein OppA n=2 Tax=Paramylibacter kogurei TaxID=1889778 RepID=A0A2G5KDE9_9RHOB|nr:oligopeptide ABC transporter substrate-binding protein OppA [Amylibacter kogurei]